jgi:hypothetical protein
MRVLDLERRWSAEKKRGEERRGRIRIRGSSIQRFWNGGQRKMLGLCWRIGSRIGREK